MYEFLYKSGQQVIVFERKIGSITLPERTGKIYGFNRHTNQYLIKFSERFQEKFTPDQFRVLD